MEGGAIPTHGKNIFTGAAPYSREITTGVTGQTRPVAAVVVEDGATLTHGKDVAAGTAPHAGESIADASGHARPTAIRTSVMKDGAAHTYAKTSLPELPHTPRR
jgi:hypothetical protein